LARAIPKWSWEPRSSEPAKEARERAWLRVLGGFFVEGLVRAAWASAAEDALDRFWTFSWMVLPRSTKDSFYSVLVVEYGNRLRGLGNRRIHLRRCDYNVSDRN